MVLLHSFIIGLYPFFSVLEFNWNEVYPSELAHGLPLGIGVASVLVVLWLLLTSSLAKAGIGVSATYICVLGYGPAARLCRGDLDTPGSGLVDLHFSPAEIFPLGVLALMLVGVWFLLRRAAPEQIRTWTGVLNLFALVLVVMTTGSVVQKKLRESSLQFPEIPMVETVHLRPSFPNVYYIILDGFARSDVLRDVYGMENPGFEEFLRERGFFVASNAVSNYFRTNYSLTSSLNMSFIEPPLVPEDRPRMLFSYLRHRLQNNAVRLIFERAGYRTVSFETGYRSTEWRDNSEYHPLTSWNRVSATAESYLQIPVLREMVSARLHSLHRERSERLFGELVPVPESPGPRFVFVHVLAPHPPFVYQKDGSLYLSHKVFTLGDGDDYGGAADYIERYTAQVSYISKRMTEILDVILRSDPGAFILVQADHGPGFQFNREDIEATNLKERFSILSAYYFPDRDYSDLYPSISPVNSFRVVMNKLAGARIPLLADRSFFAEAGDPLSFIEVTSSLR